ncbi:MAG TPA: hypothetical protein VF476_05050 [Chitinophagaceae bacterium]
MPRDKYSAWEFKPRKLSTEEANHPIEVIHDFYDFANLPQVRELFWQLFKTTVTGSFNHSLSRKERNNLFYFMEQLEKLIEATYLLHQQEKEK